MNQLTGADKAMPTTKAKKSSSTATTIRSRNHKAATAAAAARTKPNQAPKSDERPELVLRSGSMPMS